MRKKVRNKKTAQSTIPIIGINKETGIFKANDGVYSVNMEFNDINYQTSREEDQLDVFNQYSRLLNYFGDDIGIQINIRNKPIDLGNLEDKISIDYKDDKLDKYRKEYNKIVSDGLKAGKGNMKKELTLTLSVKAKNYEDAYKKLDKPIRECMSAFKGMGSAVRKLSVAERLEKLHDFFNCDDIGTFNKENIDNIKRHGLSVRDLIAPEFFEFKANYFKMNDKFARTLFIKVFPDSLSDDFIDKLVGTNLNLSVAIHYKAIDKARTIKLALRQKSNMEAEAIGREKRNANDKVFETRIPEHLKESYESATKLLKSLKKSSDKAFFTTISIVHIADSKEELEEDTEMLRGIASQYGVKLGILVQQQEEGMINSLDLGINRLYIERLLTTSEASIFTPFGTQELLQEGGIYYGKNSSSGNTLLFNRKTLKAGHGITLGVTGSGKSFQAKQEITGVLFGTDDDIIIIDLTGEYIPYVEAMGGQVINISTKSNNFINALDISEDYGGSQQDAFLLKTEFVISMFDKLIGGHSGLSPIELSLIDRACRNVYEPYIVSGYDKEKIPTMVEFQECLCKMEEGEAKHLAASLEMYSKGSLSIFGKKTSININNRLVCYSLNDLGKTLQPLAYLVVLDNIINRLSSNQNRGIYTRIYADEFHIITKNKMAREFFIKLYKISRKLGGIVHALTQQVSDVLATEELATIVSNSEFIVLLNQSSKDRITLSKLLNISETQLSFIKNAPKGTGLLILGETCIIPFENIMDKETELYKLMTTHLKEVGNSKKIG